MYYHKSMVETQLALQTIDNKVMHSSYNINKIIYTRTAFHCIKPLLVIDVSLISDWDIVGSKGH